MSNQVCLLCSRVFSNIGYKFPQKIRLKTLHKLLTLCHHNYKSLNSEYEFDGDETINLCVNCYPLFGTMEEIRRQISLLEEEMGSKINQIQAIIREKSSSQLENNGMEKIVQIRDMIFRLTARNDEEELVENLALHDDEVQVKEEHDLIDPLEVGDQFFLADNRNSYSEAASVDRAEGEEMDGLIDGEEDDTAFCIIPSSQKRSRESPRTMAPTSACHEVSTQTPGLKVFPASKNYAAIYKGFYYVHQKTGVDKHIMRCTRHNRGCHGKLHLTANYESLASTALAGAENHSHPAEPDYCELKYSVWKLKSAAKSSLEPTSAILAEQLANVSVEVQGSFPKISSLQRVVQRSRAASRLCKQTGSTPDSLVELPS